MPWWSWILIWVALAAVALLLYVLIGYRVFRKFMAVLREVQSAGARLSFAQAPVPPAPATEPRAAVFSDPADERRRYDEGKAARKEARRERRVQRRILRGQPRAWRDIPGL
ncbi:hypothetical protein [Arthrobacter koreensis]|uniref:hypothetical protein n=1 Tax=Arthrobacter koreensis TaxID=199136 RepID=UPI002DB8EC8F|nr:hypothetical protein [Arthrobacter koreensis]MEB7503439.1 hypothetical protein [Arthrobacter koreensis]